MPQAWTDLHQRKGPFSIKEKSVDKVTTVSHRASVIAAPKNYSIFASPDLTPTTQLRTMLQEATASQTLHSSEVHSNLKRKQNSLEQS